MVKDYSQDHWVICLDFIQGPYNALGAQSRLAQSNSSSCPLPHAIIRQRSESSALHRVEHGTPKPWPRKKVTR